MTSIRHVLHDIFNCDFSAIKTPDSVRKQFFDKKLTLSDLDKVSSFIRGQEYMLGGKTIPASFLIKGKTAHTPFAIMSQLHGNEPAGLAGILLAMALSEAKLLERDVLAVIGNPLAAAQYFEAYAQNPRARQETRDAFRCGLAEDGSLLPDMNRIPVDFMERKADTQHIKRAQELYTMGLNICGILDIHTARGNMVCITDHKYDRDLLHSSIRAVLLDLADAIAANASASGNKLVTFKTIVSPLPNIDHQVGIEAGRHESEDAPHIAAAYTLSLLYQIGYTKVTPLEHVKDDGIFDGYHVKPRITYADLIGSEQVQKDDMIYMAKPCANAEAIPPNASQVIVRKKGKGNHFALQTALEFIVNPQGMLCYTLHQYEEMEAVKKGDVLAVAIPSGAALKAPEDFSGIFWSKAARLYDKDPAVGPWPLTADKAATTKLCYPCEVSNVQLEDKSI